MKSSDELAAELYVCEFWPGECDCGYCDNRRSAEASHAEADEAAPTIAEVQIFRDEVSGYWVRHVLSSDCLHYISMHFSMDEARHAPGFGHEAKSGHPVRESLRARIYGGSNGGENIGWPRYRRNDR